MGRVGLAFLASAALVVGAVSSAQAVTVYTNDTLEVDEGNPLPNETNVYLDAAANVMSSVGHVGSQAGTTTLTFAATSSVTFANGFATIDPGTSAPLITSLTITPLNPAGLVWNDIEFKALGPSGNAATDLTITAYLGGTQLGTITIPNIGSGEDPLLSLIINGGTMDELVLTSTAGISEFKQFQFSADVGQTPLPSAVIMFGSGLAGLGAILGHRSRRRKGLSKTAA